MPLTRIDLTVIQVTGDNVAAFLQGQLTADILAMSHSSALLAAHCNPKGRVITLCMVIKQNNTFYLAVPNTMAELTLSALNKYAVFSKVALQDCSKSHCLIDATEVSALDQRIAWYGHRHIALQECSNDFIQNNHWHQQDVALGIPRVHPETSEKFLPQRLNLHRIPKAMSFKKGCYVGQEIIARIQFLGQLKHEMVYVNLADSAITPGQSIENEQQKVVGHVVDLMPSTTTDVFTLLAIIQSEAIDQTLSINGQSFHVEQITYHDE